MDINADVSSYAKPGAPVNMLDTMQKYGGLQQQQQQIQNNAINIDQNKLDLYNKHFNLMNQEMTTLLGMPGVTKEVALQRLNARADAFNMPAPIRQQMAHEFDNANTPQQVQDVLGFMQRRAWDTNQQINSQTTGNPGISPVQANQPVNVPNAATGRTDVVPFQKFIQQTGGNGPIPGRGPVPMPPNQLPVQQPQGMGSSGGGGDAGTPNLPVQQQPQGQPSQQPPMQPQGRTAIQGQSPLLAPGIAQYTADQQNATKLNTTNKPAELALKMMDGLRSGPGTAEWQKMLAFGKANGILPTTGSDDPTVVYQSVNKLMHNFIRGGGARSDADLAQLESSNPDLSQHLNPALVNLTREQIGLNRVQAMRPGAFQSQDYSQYGKHASQFPQTIDEKAVTLDTLPPKEAQQLYTQMKAKALKGDQQAIKFMKSLDQANKQGY